MSKREREMAIRAIGVVIELDNRQPGLLTAEERHAMLGALEALEQERRSLQREALRRAGY